MMFLPRSLEYTRLFYFYFYFIFFFTFFIFYLFFFSDSFSFFVQLFCKLSKYCTWALSVESQARIKKLLSVFTKYAYIEFELRFTLRSFKKMS